MAVSRPLGEIPTIIDPELLTALPPFWELEDLIAAGLDCEAALAVMAARRSGLRLVDGAVPSGREQSLLLRFELSDNTH